jgi:16S rRNA (cytosine967-C5)-methyltransferase
MEVTGARLEAAVEALRGVLPLGQPADLCLRRYFREHRALGRRDRAFIAESVFATLRHLRLLETLVGSRDPRRLLLAALTLVEGRSLRQLDAALLRRAGGDGADASEHDWLAGLRGADHQRLPPAVQLSLPDWIWTRLLEAMPEDTAVRLARGLLAPAPLDLRVNTLQASRDEVIAALAADGIACAATPYSPWGVRLPEKPALQRHPLFLEGRIEVQDEASQLLCLLLGARRREMVVDLCAGAGGKTLALGAMMRSEGRLYAFDTAAQRLANLGPRLQRSGLSNVHPQHIDSENDRRVQRLAGKIDRVLVDAPCSGLGTLRRNPDLKWRQSPQALAELTRKQASILAVAAPLLKPGGRLVYATCSLLREENDAIVERFLEARRDFRSESAAAILAAQGIALDTGDRFRVFPHEHAMDGFFAAVLRREG